MTVSPGSGTPFGDSSDDTAQIPAVRPAANPADDATMPGVSGFGISPLSSDETTQLPRLDQRGQPINPGSAYQGAPGFPTPPSTGVSATPSGGAAPPSAPNLGPAATPMGQSASGVAPGHSALGVPHATAPSGGQLGEAPSPTPGAVGSAPHFDDAPTVETTAVLGTTPPVGVTAGAVPPQSAGGSPGDDAPETPPVPGKKPKWFVPTVAAAAVLGVLLAFTGGTVAFAGEVPRGTHVLGIHIGGRSKAEAADVLKKALGKRVTQPVKVKIGKAESTIDPKDVGLAVDYKATAEAAVQNWPNPFTVLFGERHVDPVIKVDAKKLDSVLQKLGAAETQQLTRPAIRYEGLTPKPFYPASGRGLDPEESAKAMQKEWLRKSVVTIPLVEIKPVTSKEDVDKLLEELAKPAVAAPVTVKTSEGQFSIPPEAIAASLLMESDEHGKITPKIDGGKLKSAAKEEFAKVETPAKDAKIKVEGGKLVTTDEVDGTQVDLKKLGSDLLPVLKKSAPREVEGKLVPAKPKLTKESIAKLGIKEKVSTFTTYFTGGETRNKNILVVADEVDNALVLPGETFSLNGYTGERSYAQGYVDAPVIIGGKLKNHVGGGISQFATTLFNAAYYAGLEDVFHQPHGYYISRYPPVIEATVFYPSLDLKFRNDSEYGVLIDTSYTSNSITVSIYSTKRYEITTKWGPKKDITQPKEVRLKEKDCIPTQGIPGFAQEAWRIFKKNGKEIKRERFFWRYKAEPKFICEDPEK